MILNDFGKDFCKRKMIDVNGEEIGGAAPCQAKRGRM